MTPDEVAASDANDSDRGSARSSIEWRTMTNDDVLEYIDYIWRLVNPNARFAQPDDDGYEPISPADSVVPLMEALDRVIRAEYDDDNVVMLNRIFGTMLAAEQWPPFLEVKSGCTIGDLAGVLALEARAPVVEPLHVADMTDWEAGVFRVVVALLEQDGVDPREIRPTTQLRSYLLRNADVFQWQVARIAPSHMPPTHHRYHPWVEYAQVALKIVTLGLIVMCGPGFLYFKLTGTPIPLGVWIWVIALVAACACWLPMGLLKPRLATAGELTTFHDLCSALAVRFRESSS